MSFMSINLPKIVDGEVISLKYNLTDNKAEGYIGSTSRFDPQTVIFDDGDFIVVKGFWKEDGHVEKCFAMRWYSGHPGYPNSRGYPQWMCVPDIIGKSVKMISELKSLVH